MEQATSFGGAYARGEHTFRDVDNWCDFDMSTQASTANGVAPPAVPSDNGASSPPSAWARKNSDAGTSHPACVSNSFLCIFDQQPFR